LEIGDGRSEVNAERPTLNIQHPTSNEGRTAAYAYDYGERMSLQVRSKRPTPKAFARRGGQTEQAVQRRMALGRAGVRATIDTAREKLER